MKARKVSVVSDSGKVYVTSARFWQLYSGTVKIVQGLLRLRRQSRTPDWLGHYHDSIDGVPTGSPSRVAKTTKVPR